jgi:hypothetical protein
LTITGTVATAADLPTSGMAFGDIYLASDTDHCWLWSAPSPGSWVDIGPLEQGPQGPAGPPAVVQTPVLGGFTPPVGSGTSSFTCQDVSWAFVGRNCYVARWGGNLSNFGSFLITAINGNVLTVTNLPGTY